MRPGPRLPGRALLMRKCGFLHDFLLGGALLVVNIFFTSEIRLEQNMEVLRYQMAVDKVDSKQEQETAGHQSGIFHVLYENFAKISASRNR